MRNTTRLLLCSTVAALGVGLCPDLQAAGLLSPVLPPDDLPPVPTRLRAEGKLRPASLIQAVTTTADGGPGSLRQLIADASPGDTIVFSIPLPAVLSLTDRLVIDKDLKVVGPGPNHLTLQRSEAPGTPDFRVLHIRSGVVWLSDLTLRNGRVPTPAFGDLVGGGIYNLGSLTVSNCVLTDNVAPTGTVASASGGRGFGGGIFSVGRLVIYNSTFHHNTASVAGGGIYAFFPPDFLADGCTVARNRVGEPGSPPNTEGQGGGINCHGTTSALIRNCTISGNTVHGQGDGGGVLNLSFGSEASSLTIESSTITDNSGRFNGGVASVSFSGGGPVVTTLRNTLVAQNTGPNFTLMSPAVFVSRGHNLDSDGSSGFFRGMNGDIVGSPSSPVNARLRPLKGNGGLTATHELLPDSPAVDAGDGTGAPPADQRGFARIAHRQMDMGAFELQITAPSIVCPFNMRTNPAPGQSSQVVSFAPLYVAGFPVPTVVCSPASGTSFPLGTTVVTCTASSEVSSVSCSFNVTVASSGAAGGVELAIVRPSLAPASPANPQNWMLPLEFQTQTGWTYYVQYSDTLPTWRTVLPAIQGTGATVQWLDNGPPKTARPPAEVVSRVYRVIQVPTP